MRVCATISIPPRPQWAASSGYCFSSACTAASAAGSGSAYLVTEAERWFVRSVAQALNEYCGVRERGTPLNLLLHHGISGVEHDAHVEAVRAVADLVVGAVARAVMWSQDGVEERQCCSLACRIGRVIPIGLGALARMSFRDCELRSPKSHGNLWLGISNQLHGGSRRRERAARTCQQVEGPCHRICKSLRCRLRWKALR